MQRSDNGYSVNTPNIPEKKSATNICNPGKEYAKPNSAPAKEAIAPRQRAHSITRREKQRGDTREHSQSLERPPKGLPSVDPQILPITDTAWQERNRLASYQEAASFVGQKNHKRSALALHGFSESLRELRDELDAAGWDVEARWVHHAASSLNMAGRFAWTRGAK